MPQLDYLREGIYLHHFDTTPVFCCEINSGVLAPGHPTPLTPVKLCSVMIIAVARS